MECDFDKAKGKCGWVTSFAIIVIILINIIISKNIPSLNEVASTTSSLSMLIKLPTPNQICHRNHYNPYHCYPHHHPPQVGDPPQ